MSVKHFRISATQAICGERIGDDPTASQEVKEVLAGKDARNVGAPVTGACPDCAAALAVTKLIGKRPAPPPTPAPTPPPHDDHD